MMHTPQKLTHFLPIPSAFLAPEPSFPQSDLLLLRLLRARRGSGVAIDKRGRIAPC